jgi:CHAT domain-containing protein
VLLLAVLLVVRPVAAQDVDQLIKTGDTHLAALRYVQAHEQYSAIPDQATPDQLLSKHVGIAMALMGQGKFTDVLPHVTGALALAKQIGTDSAMARAENVNGQYQDNLRIGDHGISALLRAADLAGRANNTQALSAIYVNLANAYQGLDDHERDAYYTQKAYELESNPSPVRSFNYRIGRGISFFELYDRNAAEAEYLMALELSAQTKRPRDRSYALGELAYFYWTFDKDNDRALQYYDEAIALARQAKAAPLEANWFANRGNVFRDTGDYERAEADYREGIRILEAGGGANTFFMWKNIGQTMRLRGDTKAAVSLLSKLIAERSGDARLRHLWQAHMELASAYATLGDRVRAEEHFVKMLDVLEEQRNTSILDSFRTGTFTHALSLYDPWERYIRFLLEQGEARVLDALNVAERAHARGFLEALASVRGAVAAKLPAALLEEESRIGKAISAAQERLRAPSLDKARRDAALAELSQAEQARENFIIAMRVEHPALAEARYPTLLPASEIQRSLRGGETAFAFFLAEPASIRWTITRDQISFARLPSRGEIETRARSVRGLLNAPSDLGATRAATGQLAAALFSGVTIPGEAPIVIVPHGVLNYIPFEALPIGDALIVEHHAVSYAPSLNALVRLRRASINAAPFRVLAVGNPPIAAAPGAATRAGDVENLALLGPLPFAEQELHSIGRTFPGHTRIMSGASARESDLRAADISRYPVIHFATHGLVSDAQPKRSGLLLAPEPGEDGLLQTSEIYGLDLNANLIVLSACQTALGKEITGEGLVGLSRAFFYAGARSVVATLWNLNDRFAAEFIARFYRELNTGLTAEEALRRAKAAYVNHPQYAHPFYWSSLVMLGDGTPALVAEPVTEPRSQQVLAVLFASLALGIAAASIGKSRKSRAKLTI